MHDRRAVAAARAARGRRRASPPSSAPSARARSRRPRSRPAATTRSAPRSFAPCTATLPDVPLAPRTSTRSPGPTRAALERVPADDPGDAERDGRRVVDVGLDRHEPVGRDRRPLRERPVARDAEAVAEDVDAVAVRPCARRPRSRACTAAADGRRRSGRRRRRDRAGSARPRARRASSRSPASGSRHVRRRRARRRARRSARRASDRRRRALRRASRARAKCRSRPEISSARRVSTPGATSRKPRLFASLLRASIRTPRRGRVHERHLGEVDDQPLRAAPRRLERALRARDGRCTGRARRPAGRATASPRCSTPATGASCPAVSLTLSPPSPQTHSPVPAE